MTAQRRLAPNFQDRLLFLRGRRGCRGINRGNDGRALQTTKETEKEILVLILPETSEMAYINFQEILVGISSYPVILRGFFGKGVDGFP
jgi:hypothetical protein